VKRYALEARRREGETTCNSRVARPCPPSTRRRRGRRSSWPRTPGTPGDPEKVALAYTEDSVWRNRDEFFQGREVIKEFLRRKWERELDYRLEKNLWCFTENRIAVRFEYESRDVEGQWWRSHGNELWEFDGNGLMKRRDASINDYKIDESERRIFQADGLDSSARLRPREPGSRGR
jgi:hypothetical protein